MSREEVYLSLGSNLGNRESNLAQATIALSINFEITDIISSSYYVSEPLYNKDQPEFLNSVVKFCTTLKPFEVLDVTQKVEKMLGKSNKSVKNQPRIIDIDILFFGNSVIETEKLSIPHPMIALRKFVLLPLAEIEPDFNVPHSKITISDLIYNCPDKSRVVRHFMDVQA
tara:strand:- start:807 stop:1316 length:510 start_codon:yes stop_codon:yes gene_type:complete